MAADVFTDTTVLRWPFTSKLKAKKGAGGVSQTSLGLTWIWIDRGFLSAVFLEGRLKHGTWGFKRGPSFFGNSLAW